MPSKIGDRTTVDPDTSVVESMYLFSIDELLSTQELLVGTVSVVEGVKETHAMRTVPHTIAPLPPHADLIHTLDAARTSEEVTASHPMMLGRSSVRRAKRRWLLYGDCGSRWGGASKRPRYALSASVIQQCAPANPRLEYCCLRRIALP